MTDGTLDSLFGAVEQITPMLREHGARSEKQCRLAQEIVEAMVGAGLYRVWTPKAYGGLEAHPVTGAEDV